MQAEIRAAIQGFGEQYGSELQQLRAKVREQRETVESFQEYLHYFSEIKTDVIFIVEDAVSNLPLKQFNDLLQSHNSVLKEFSLADLNERVEGFN